MWLTGEAAARLAVALRSVHVDLKAIEAAADKAVAIETAQARGHVIRAIEICERMRETSETGAMGGTRGARKDER